MLFCAPRDTSLSLLTMYACNVRLLRLLGGLRNAVATGFCDAQVQKQSRVHHLQSLQ